MILINFGFTKVKIYFMIYKRILSFGGRPMVRQLPLKPFIIVRIHAPEHYLTKRTRVPSFQTKNQPWREPMKTATGKFIGVWPRD